MTDRENTPPVHQNAQRATSLEITENRDLAQNQGIAIQVKKMLDKFQVISPALYEIYQTHKDKPISLMKISKGLVSDPNQRLSAERDSGSEYRICDSPAQKAIQNMRIYFNDIDSAYNFKVEKEVVKALTKGMSNKKDIREFYLKYPLEFFCNSTSYEKDIRKFQLQAKSKRTPCPLCNNQFLSDSLDELLKHMESCHKAIEIYGCNFCYQLFREKESWIDHNQQPDHSRKQNMRPVMTGICCVDCGLVLTFRDQMDERYKEDLKEQLKKLSLNHCGKYMVYFVFIANGTDDCLTELTGKMPEWIGQANFSPDNGFSNNFRTTSCPFPECKSKKTKYKEYFQYVHHLANHLEDYGMRYWFSVFLKQKQNCVDSTSLTTVNKEIEKISLQNDINSKASFVYRFPRNGDSAGVIQNTNRIMKCQLCNGICVGLKNSREHAIHCSGIDMQNYYELFIPIENQGIMLQIAPPNRIPNSPIVCPQCDYHCCSIQGFIIHSTYRHAQGYYIVKNSINQFLTRERSLQFNLQTTPFVTAAINQYCGLTFDGKLREMTKNQEDNYIVRTDEELILLEDGGEFTETARKRPGNSEVNTTNEKLETLVGQWQNWAKFIQVYMEWQKKRQESAQANAMSSLNKYHFSRKNSKAEEEFALSSDDAKGNSNKEKECSCSHNFLGENQQMEIVGEENAIMVDTESEIIDNEPPRKQIKISISEQIKQGIPATDSLRNEITNSSLKSENPTSINLTYIEVSSDSGQAFSPSSNHYSLPPSVICLDHSSSPNPYIAPQSVICLDGPYQSSQQDVPPVFFLETQKNDPSASSLSSTGSSQLITPPSQVPVEEMSDESIIYDDEICIIEPGTGSSAREDIVYVEDDIEIVIGRASTSNQQRELKYKCNVCTGKSFMTQAGLDDHKKTHEKDVSQLDPTTTKTFGIPLNAICYLCPTCTLGFESKDRHTKHMDLHVITTKANQSLFLCDYCSAAAVTQDMMNKHMGSAGHGLASPENPERAHISSEYWCTGCMPHKVFLSDAGYFLHIMECHNTPLFYFCKNCLMGSVNYEPIWRHIHDNTCVNAKNSIETRIAFAVAPDIHYQPIDEEKHEKLCKSNFVKPNTCAGRTMLRFSFRFASCMEKNEVGEKCMSLCNFYRYESYYVAKHKLHKPDGANLRTDEFPPIIHVSSEYNMYEWLRFKMKQCNAPPVEYITPTKQKIFQNILEIYPNPAEPIGRSNPHRSTVTHPQRRQRRNTTQAPLQQATISVHQLSHLSAQNVQIDPRRVSFENTEKRRHFNHLKKMDPNVLNERINMLRAELSEIKRRIPQYNLNQELQNRCLRLETEIDTCKNIFNQKMSHLTAIYNNQAPQGTIYNATGIRPAETRVPHTVAIHRRVSQTRLHNQIAIQQISQAMPDDLRQLMQQAQTSIQQHPAVNLQQMHVNLQLQQSQHQSMIQIPPQHQFSQQSRQFLAQIQQRNQPRSSNHCLAPVLDQSQVQISNIIERDFMVPCPICTLRRPKLLMITVLNYSKEKDNFIKAVLDTVADNLPHEQRDEIAARMRTSHKICFDHVNPHGVVAINIGAAKRRNRHMKFTVKDPSFVSFNYALCAQPALDLKSYIQLFDEEMEKCKKGEITPEYFHMQLKKANQCRHTSCSNAPLTSNALIRLHAFHRDENKNNLDYAHVCIFGCYNSYRDEQEIIFHMLEHLAKDMKSEPGRIKYETSCPLPNCGINYDSLSNLKYHLSQEHSVTIPAEQCSQLFSSDNARISHSIEHQKPNSTENCCMLCGQSELFPKTDDMREGQIAFQDVNHDFIHCFEVSYACGICMEGFTSHYELIQHCRRSHLIGLTPKCIHCDVAVSETEIAAHITHYHELRLFGVRLSNQTGNTSLNRLVVKTPPDMKFLLGFTPILT